MSRVTADSGRARGGQQRRSRERRDQLLQATIELIATGGPRVVTHRAVSIQAGLPPSSAGYYFETVDDLIEQALIAFAAARLGFLDEMLDEATEGASRIAEISDRVARTLVGHGASASIAEFEIYLESARNPALRDAVAASMREFEDGAARRLATLGLDDPTAAARAFVAVINGFALNRLAMPETAEDDADLLRKVFLGLYAAFTLGEDGLIETLGG